MSLHVESYESVEVHDENAREFSIDLIIRICINLIQERAYFSHEFFCTLELGYSVFTHTIIVEAYDTLSRLFFSLKFDISAVDG